MKPIFYKCETNNECYKLVMEDGIHLKQIDACIYAMTGKKMHFITEQEFESSALKFMDVDVMDETSTFKIGTLTFKWMDLDTVSHL
jgi:mannose-1-phosphate guanylyltransferase